ncbi:helix-turn-helix domain-containing protein [Paenibacillus sp. CF384]|uniref:response regulator transcription factor n=1 Tax=Paenibacillus sp. CF384 TaxID=1884382 RepID=UPI000895EE76|nr:helix-turn-helix domain-containing protein [Paenibacillus sp. CF384]SDX34236.1 Response regulator receiver domain-containing protein [Paenibacillus sp. CF384]
MKLLIVEDEAPILRGLLRKINQFHTPFTDITGASGAAEALETLRQHGADLVMTDINMPEMNGLELIQTAKNEGLCSRFIILSGYDDFSYARDALRLQVIDYLLKPIDDEQLEELLTRLGQAALAEHEKHEAEEQETFTEVAEHDYVEKPEASKQMLEYIEANYVRDLSLSSVAEHVGLHPNYVSHLFKKETGMNVLAYIQQLRVIKAKELLISRPSLPLSEVAMQTGFESQRHFFKVFKKHTNMTPRQFGEAQHPAK